MTPTFHSLRVADVRRETADAVSIAFEVPPALASAYAFQAGQYLTLRRHFEGEEVRRSYSICAAPQEGELRVAVKRVKDGLFSAFANEDLAPGALIDVMTPMGRFTVDPDADRARRVLLVAAGSGITPIIAIAKTLLAREPATEVTLLYGNRTTADILFRAEIEDLKDQYLARFTVLHVLSREDHGSALLSGRIDGDKVARVVAGALGGVDEAYLCGPQAMTEVVKARLEAIGLPGTRVHVELFTASAPTKARPKATAAETSGMTTPLTLTLGGRTHRLDPRVGETVIEAGRRAGLDVPFACTGGMCCTCRAKLVTGDAPMDVNYSLEPWEIAAGFVLTCQARIGSTPVTVDYDAM